MSLANIVIPRRTTPVPGSPEGVTVRGLSTYDLGVLLSDHREDLLAAVALFEEAKGNPVQFVTDIMQVLPKFAAKAIALAADEPQGAALVGQLPATVQLAAALDVIELTVTDPAALPLLIGRLTQVLGGVSAAGKTSTPFAG